ncbi:hypothetical protein MFRU_009g02450 [Monilinia fructicola]|nr:hypothetical protein MFRU_009g02450 [Monilinia fructicola]
MPFATRGRAAVLLLLLASERFTEREHDSDSIPTKMPTQKAQKDPGESKNGTAEALSRCDIDERSLTGSPFELVKEELEELRSFPDRRPPPWQSR